MISRLLLSVVLGWALFSSGLMSCGTNGPGGEVTNTEESGSDTTVATAGGTTGTSEPSGGATAEDTTGGPGGGTATSGTTATGGTGTSGTTTGGGTATGGSGSGGTITLTGGASICVTQPILCEGLQPVEVPGLTAGSPIGGPAVGPAVGGGGVGDYPAPDVIYKAGPGIDAIKRFGQQGVVTTPVVQEDLIQGGTFTAPEGFVMIDGYTKEFAKGTVVTVTKNGVATVTTPEGVETLPSDATLIFTGGAAVTRNGTSSFTLQPGHAVRFGAGNFQIFQSGIGGMKAPAVERQIGR